MGVYDSFYWMLARWKILNWNLKENIRKLNDINFLLPFLCYSHLLAMQKIMSEFYELLEDEDWEQSNMPLNYANARTFRCALQQTPNWNNLNDQTGVVLLRSHLRHGFNKSKFTFTDSADFPAIKVKKLFDRIYTHWGNHEKWRKRRN